MYSAFGIVNSIGRHIFVEGLEEYRPIGAFSFMGRYRIIDFPISNMSNSGIDRIQVYTGRNPRSLADHLGTGRHYNINSKRGRLQVFFSDDAASSAIYNNDITAFMENMEYIERMHESYVVIAPSYMIYSMDYDALIQSHAHSEADVTLAYHTVDNAKESFFGCRVLNLNKQKGVLSIETNNGSAKNRHIFMDTYVMTKEVFIDLVKKAKNTSSMYTFADIINDSCEELDIRGYSHRGYFAAITDFQSYYESNLSLINFKTANELFHDDWPIYTKTNDSCPAHYFETAHVKDSVISNGCHIEGTVEHSIIGRGCHIAKGAVVKNSVILADAYIGPDVHVVNQVVDKRANLEHVKTVISAADHPGYVKKDDII